MKKTVRMFSLLLALILGLSVCCAGFAEEAAAIDEKAAMEFFVTMMQLVPGMEGIDWEAFVKEYDEKKASGAEITLEDCLSKEAWNAYSALMFMDENGQVITDSPMVPVFGLWMLLYAGMGFVGVVTLIILFAKKKLALVSRPGEPGRIETIKAMLTSPEMWMFYAGCIGIFVYSYSGI